MSKYVKLLLKSGEVRTYEIICPYPIDYPIMCSVAENLLAAELDFHKMRIVAEAYTPVYNDGNKIISMNVNGNNITIHLLNDPTEEEKMSIINIWSAKMKMGYCEVLHSNIFK